MEQNGNARFGNIKEKNLKMLFNKIAYSEGISRAQLAREAGLSKPAVSALVDELIALGLVATAGEGESGQGRKPIRLKRSGEHGQFMTVAFSRETAAYRLYDFALNPLESFDLPVQYHKNCVAGLMKEIGRRSVRLRPDAVTAQCFTLPAAVGAGRNEIRSTVLNLDPDLNLIDEIGALPGTKALVNETIAYAYAEQRRAFRGEHNLIFAEVSEGVGAGIIIDDRVFRGVSGSAGEFGHISVDKNGPQCCCGRRGCLETLVSKPAILRKAAQAGLPADYAGLAAAMADGDEAALRCMRGIAAELAFGLGNVIAMFDIAAIVLGGGVEELGEPFLAMLREDTDKMLICGEYRTKNDLAIHYAKLGQDARNLGAAQYYSDNLLPVITPPQELCLV